MDLIEEIGFGVPVDVDADDIMDIIPIEKTVVKPLIHYAWNDFRGAWWRFTIAGLPGVSGSGVIFINPYMPGDVDVLTFNNDTGVFWGAGSQLAGKFAAASGGWFDLTTMDFVPGMAARFPSTGADPIPGNALWGDPLDGFGDGVPDPKGSSILMLPLLLLGDEWNGTDWEPTIFSPLPMVLTTAKAYDIVAQPESALYGLNSTEQGEPWEFTQTCLDWDDPKAFVKVTYVAAWSDMLYCLNPDEDGDGAPDPEPDTGWTYTLDSFWEYEEQKVRADQVICDINCDKVVNIKDIAICCKAFGSWDEGLGVNHAYIGDANPNTPGDNTKAADPRYDARADVSDIDNERGYGTINIYDLVTIALDFGKTLDP